MIRANVVRGFGASLIMSLATVPGSAQADARITQCAVPLFDDRCEVFASVFDNDGAGGWNLMTGMTLDPAGQRIYVTGMILGTHFDMFTGVYDPVTGDRIGGWLFNHGDTNENAFDVAVSPDGATVFVTGAVIDRRPGYSDVATVAYDVTSPAPKWVAFHDSAGKGVGMGRSIVVSPDGTRVFVTGPEMSPTVPGSRDYVTVAYDASTGTELWAKHYHGPSSAWAWEIAASPDGSAVFVTGTSGNDGATVAYDADSGDRLWVQRVSTDARTELSRIVVDPAGEHVVVVGRRAGPKSAFDTGTADEIIIASYDPVSGDQQWLVRRVVAPIPDLRTASVAYPYGLAVSPDGATIYLAAAGTETAMTYPYVPPFDLNMMTIALDSSNGAQRWYSTSSPISNDTALGLAVSPDGERVYTTGYAYIVPGRCDVLTVAYDAQDGSQEWIARHDEQQPTVEHFQECESGHYAAVSPDNSRVFVGGLISNLQGGNPNPFNFGVLGYDG